MKKQIITALFALLVMPWVSAADSLIRNGDFSKNDIRPWKVFSIRTTKKPTHKVTNGILRINSPYATKCSRRQLTQKLPNLKSKTKYKLSFEAKASNGDTEISVTLARSKNWDKGHYGFLHKVKLKKEWKPQTFYFTTKELEQGNTPVLKFLIGGVKGNICLRHVKLEEVKAKG